MSIPKGPLYEPAPPKTERAKDRPQERESQLPGMKEWAEDPNQPWTNLDFNQFGLRASLAAKTIQALYYTAGSDRLLTIVLVRSGGETTGADVLLHQARLDCQANPLHIPYR